MSSQVNSKPRLAGAQPLAALRQKMESLRNECEEECDKRKQVQKELENEKERCGKVYSIFSLAFYFRIFIMPVRYHSSTAHRDILLTI